MLLPSALTHSNALDKTSRGAVIGTCWSMLELVIRTNLMLSALRSNWGRGGFSPLFLPTSANDFSLSSALSVV